MTFAGTNLAEGELFNVTFTSSAGTAQTFTMATRGLRWDGVLTITDTSGGTTLAKATLDLDGDSTGAVLTISGTVAAGLTSTSGTVDLEGNVSISTATAFIDFGSEAWDVAGNWTNSTTSASWDAGTGTMTFSSASSIIMTFAGANLAEDEFSNLIFDSTGAVARTFTMATRSLRFGGTLTIRDSVASTTELATANLAIDNFSSGTLVVGNGGILTANASAVFVGNVTMTGGTSGVITITTGVWQLGAVGTSAWNTSGAGSTFTQGTGIVTIANGNAGTITMLSTDNTFDDLTIAAGAGNAVTLASAIVVTNGLIVSTGTLAKSTFAITSVTTLTMSGGDLTSTSGAVTVTGNVNISAAASAIDFGSEAWTVGGTWTNVSTDAAVWDAGTGSINFTAVIATAITFANPGLNEDEFNAVTFSGAATFTGTGSLFAVTTTVGVAATFNPGTNDMRFDRLDVDGTLVMDGITVPDIDIDGSVGTIRLTAWTVYSITGGGVPDIRWTMDPSDGGNNVVIIVAGLTALTTFAVYRDAVEILTAGSDGAGVFTASGGALNSGWSSHDMIIALPGLVWGGGGGGTPTDPVIDWTWRHLGEDLLIQFTIISPNTLWSYEWIVDGKTGLTGYTVEQRFDVSGKHVVVLKATFLDKTYQSSKDIEARSLSFVGRYIPVLILVLIAIWLIVLVLAETYKSDAGRFLATLSAVGLFAAAYFVLQNAYLTFGLASSFAIQMFAGTGLIVAATSLKRAKLFGAILLVVGLGLLAMVYAAILTF